MSVEPFWISREADGGQITIGRADSSGILFVFSREEHNIARRVHAQLNRAYRLGALTQQSKMLEAIRKVQA